MYKLYAFKKYVDTQVRLKKNISEENGEFQDQNLVPTLVEHNNNSNIPPTTCRPGAERPDRKVLRLADAAPCGARGQGRSGAASRQGRQGHPDVAVCAGHVAASAVQHLSAAVPGDVHLRHLRDVVLHAREGQERAGRRVQLQDVRPEHDPAVSSMRC